MQPLYCTWEANGAKAHTPGLFRRGRVTFARGWINSALGSMATIEVSASEDPARDQKWVSATFWPAEGTEVSVHKDGTVTVRRRV